MSLPNWVYVLWSILLVDSLVRDATLLYKSYEKEADKLERRSIVAFSADVVRRAWQRAGGRCECTRKTHDHIGTCDKQLGGKTEAGKVGVNGKPMV